ncbi:hypothetical protein HK102_005417, partial [Quaeritorhiza haematococci]
MDLEAMAVAVVRWVNTIEAVPRQISSLKDLADGSAFYAILTEIDPQWFKLMRQIEAGDNWVLKFNNLKKLYKLLLGYFEEVLGQNTSAMEVPNLTTIARDGDDIEILKLAQIVLLLAVQCENNQVYILKIQQLDQGSQHALMLTIEQAMSKLGVAPVPQRPTSGIFDNSLQVAFVAEKQELESQRQNLQTQLLELQLRLETVQTERDELTSRLKDMEMSMSQLSEAGKVDFVLRNEIAQLKHELEKSENKRIEADMLVEKQTALISELQKKVDENTKKAEEATRLKDQVDEFRHMADRLQKSEAMIEKYRKRLEETADLRKQVKTLEDQNQQYIERNIQMEEEYRKLLSFKPLMETYKEQISQLEVKNSGLQLSHSKMEFELKEMRAKYEKIEVERRADAETIMSLEDQLREYDMNNVGTGRALAGELSTELQDSANATLQKRVFELEKELKQLRINQASDENATKIVLLQNQLEDANRLKAKVEQDYLALFQKNLAFENEINQMKSVSAADGEQALRRKVVEYEQELAALKRQIGDQEALLVQKGTSSAAGGAGAGGSETISPSSIGAASEYDKLKKQHETLVNEHRISAAHINKLIAEKEALQFQQLEIKEELLQQERTVSELKSVLAAMESKGQPTDETAAKLAQATTKVVYLQEQNSALHKALKQAKERIVSQDKHLKEIKAIGPKENFTEAITSYEAALKEKDMEMERIRGELNDTRAAAKREQRMISSA